MLALSEHLGQDVLAADGRALGRLVDLAVRLDERHPPVRLALVRRRGAPRVAFAWDDVASFERGAVELRPGARELPGAGPDDVLLVRDVLDVRVLAVGGRRLDRVGDVELVRDGSLLRLTAVELGAVPLLRRLGLRRLAAGRTAQRLDWGDARLASGRGHALEVATPHPERPLGGMEVAQLVSHLPAERAVELLRLADPANAASALGTVRPRLGGRLVDALGAEAGAIVAAMPLDDAAAALRHLDRARLDELLRAVPGERAAELARLLAYPAASAGGLMTSEVLVAPATSSAEELRALVAGARPRLEALASVLLVDGDGALVGVLPPSALLAGSTEPVRVPTVRADAPVERVIDVFALHDVLVLPVVDEAGRPLGAIAVDDVLEELLLERLPGRRRLAPVLARWRRAPA